VFLIIPILCSWLSGYRDMYGFVYREKNAQGNPIWNEDQLADWFPYWESKPGSKTDPWHMAGGAMWALLFIWLVGEAIYHFLTGDLLLLKPMFVIKWDWYYLILTFVLHALILWQVFYWVRNSYMHYFGRSKKSKDWRYLLPPPLHKLFKKKK